MAHSFKGADHLPNNRERRDPPDPAGLPRQRRGTTPQMHGRYPDYDVLASDDHWDEVTRAVVRERVDSPPPIRFFSDDEERCARAFTDLVLAQDAEPRIPVVEMVDAKLFTRSFDGYRYADMPEDDETWRLVLRGLDEAAGPGGFASARHEDQVRIVEALAAGELHGGAWERLDVSRAWSVVMRATLAAFYSHPWAWNEIGFGGPAYPRGYMRLKEGPTGTDPHEREEVFGLDPVEDLAERGEA